MRKSVSLLLCVLMLCPVILPVLAASAGPEITMQSQSPVYPEYAVAMYTVEASGTNLHATWYLEWEGYTYNLSDMSNGFEPWEAYAGESYGPHQNGDNTFSCFFAGIEEELNGAYIWCVIEDGHYDTVSQKARILVGAESTPPTIVRMPTYVTVSQGETAEVRCIAQAPEGTQLSFLWYETDSGNLEDMRAVNRGTETTDYMFCDTAQPGTRKYLCMVQTSDGGTAYSSIVYVTVTAKAHVPDPPTIQTQSLPEATAGSLYETQIACTDPEAVFFLYFNPGQANDFDKTGLTLQTDGRITGIPGSAGSYEFCVCASGAGGEDYRVYTLTVREPETAATEPEQTQPPQTETAAPRETDPPQTEAQPDTRPDDRTEVRFTVSDVPWWVLVLVGAVASGGGVALAFLLVKRK